MKIALTDLKAVTFKEKHTSDSPQEPVFSFDIDIPEKEIIDLNRLYCARLLECVLNLDKRLIKAFLAYQCKSKLDPICWLNSLEQLIRLNVELLIQFGLLKEITDLFSLIEKQRDILRQYQFERPQIQIVDSIA